MPFCPYSPVSSLSALTAFSYRYDLTSAVAIPCRWQQVFLESLFSRIRPQIVDHVVLNACTIHHRYYTTKFLVISMRLTHAAAAAVCHLVCGFAAPVQIASFALFLQLAAIQPFHKSVDAFTTLFHRWCYYRLALCLLLCRYSLPLSPCFSTLSLNKLVTLLDSPSVVTHD